MCYCDVEGSSEDFLRAINSRVLAMPLGVWTGRHWVRQQYEICKHVLLEISELVVLYNYYSIFIITYNYQKDECLGFGKRCQCLCVFKYNLSDCFVFYLLYKYGVEVESLAYY